MARPAIDVGSSVSRGGSAQIKRCEGCRGTMILDSGFMSNLKPYVNLVQIYCCDSRTWTRGRRKTEVWNKSAITASSWETSCYPLRVDTRFLDSVPRIKSWIWRVNSGDYFDSHHVKDILKLFHATKTSLRNLYLRKLSKLKISQKYK